jgi:hypothetical protein
LARLDNAAHKTTSEKLLTVHDVTRLPLQTERAVESLADGQQQKLYNDKGSCQSISAGLDIISRYLGRGRRLHSKCARPHW